MSAVITFLRVRPGHNVNELTAATRKREGTTSLELTDEPESAIAGCIAGGVLPVVVGGHKPGAAAWVASPHEARELGDDATPGWRITVLHTADRSDTLDALARTEAAYLRTGRSRIGEAAHLVSLPSIDARVSAFVDTIDHALSAVAAGATDLLFRDWESGQIGELREALTQPLVERVAIPPGIDIGLVRKEFGSELFACYLNLVDASGVARPRYEWAPGMDQIPPMNIGRLSAEWPDSIWVDGVASQGTSGATGPVRRILAASLDGTPPSPSEMVTLFKARGNDVDAIADTADIIRHERVGDTVTYVVNRNINYTNVCYFPMRVLCVFEGSRGALT